MKKAADPIEILRSLLERVEQRRAAEQHPEDQEAQDQASAAGAELVPDYKGRPIYISFDGDDIGNAVARAEAKDDEEALTEISQRINAGQDLFIDFLMYHQGKLVEAGGDEGLGRCSSNCLEDIEEFRSRYQEVVGATVTVGIGEKISQATKARMLGKLRGKDQVCHYDDSTESELEMRSQQGGHEAEKLGQAGLIPQGQPGEVPKFGISPEDSVDGADWQQEYDQPEGEEGQEPEEGQPEAEQQEPKEDQSDQAEEAQEPEGDQAQGAIEDEEAPEGEEEEGQPEEEEEGEEYYDYSDLPFDEQRDMEHTERAHKIAREEGADPNFLRAAARSLFRR